MQNLQIKKDNLTIDYHELRFSKHECACFIEDCIRKKLMRKCVHLVNWKCGNGFGAIWYSPICKERSFVIHADKNYSLEGCSMDCRFYYSHRKLFFKDLKTKLMDIPRHVINGIKTLFKGYASLPWITQVLFFFMLLFFLKANELITFLFAVLTKRPGI